MRNNMSYVYMPVLKKRLALVPCIVHSPSIDGMNGDPLENDVFGPVHGDIILRNAEYDDIRRLVNWVHERAYGIEQFSMPSGQEMILEGDIHPMDVSELLDRVRSLPFADHERIEVNIIPVASKTTEDHEHGLPADPGSHPGSDHAEKAPGPDRA